jgi:hypothetical protein
VAAPGDPPVTPLRVLLALAALTIGATTLALALRQPARETRWGG